eukprot:symbB.v1.2.035845.t1/scaffold4917.1/size32959/1
MGSSVSCLEEEDKKDLVLDEDIEASTASLRLADAFRRRTTSPTSGLNVHRSISHNGSPMKLNFEKDRSFNGSPFNVSSPLRQLSREAGMSRDESANSLMPMWYAGSRQVSAPLREVSASDSRWACALDRPSDFSRATVELAMDFPMWLMPAKVLMSLEGPLQPHHELVDSGKLVRWQEGGTRKVVLISHQWAGKRHPDPNMEQIKVLQELLREMAAGKVQVTKDMIGEASGSDLVLPSEEEQLDCMEWDIWYDFFGIPQVDDRGCVASIPELQAAVDSIPAYCDAADYVIILAPTISHADTGALMNYATWGTRGWCRVERTATALSAKEKPLLVVTGSSSIVASSGAEWIQNWPHDGDFTVEEDRATVKTLTKQLLELKCACMLQQMDVSRWRFYKALSVKILQSRSPWSRPGQPRNVMQKTGDLRMKEQILDSFKVSYQFASVFFLEPGLTPLMLACIEGCSETVQLLIDSKVDVNAVWHGSLREVQIEGNHSALSIAAALSSPQVTACLLEAGAKIDASRDNQGNSLIGIAALFGNHEVIRVLAEKGLEVQKRNDRGDCPLICATLTQNSDVLRTLLELRANPNVKSSFGQSPLAMSAMQGLVKHAEYLLEFAADVNGIQEGSKSQVQRRQSQAFGSFARSAARSRSRSRDSESPMERRERTVEEVLLGTPLHLAAFTGNWPMAELLLRYNADPLHEGEVRATAVEVAEDCGHNDLLLKLTGAAKMVDFFRT